jgi:hypothetical protein
VLLALTHHGAIRVAELGFLLVAVAGALLALGELAPARSRTAGFVAGVALAVGAVLVIVATHWGHFG